MEQYLEFVTNHPVLIAALVGILAALLWSTLSEMGGAGAPVSGLEATRLMNTESAVIVDVREAAEFERGHIVEAVNLPFTRFNDRKDELDRYKDRPIVLVCAHGMQSRTAARELKKAGFTRLHSLRGGISQWRTDNLPLTRGRK